MVNVDGESWAPLAVAVVVWSFGLAWGHAAKSLLFMSSLMSSKVTRFCETEYGGNITDIEAAADALAASLGFRLGPLSVVIKLGDPQERQSLLPHAPRIRVRL